MENNRQSILLATIKLKLDAQKSVLLGLSAESSHGGVWVA